MPFPNANSNFNTRPLKFEFVKESEEYIQNEFEDLDKQINDIKHCRVVINGKEITFKVVVHPTMYDGKSITAITKLILKKYHAKHRLEDNDDNDLIEDDVMDEVEDEDDPLVNSK
ncbi:MAG: hypothetical protein VYC37_02475 [Thermoproteota archaeon]|nr:hypothetical protein [Thermoproteota archaeon]